MLQLNYGRVAAGCQVIVLINHSGWLTGHH